MEALFALPAFVLIFFGFIFVFFLVFWPIVLFFQFLFDSRVEIGLKIILFITTFIVYPLPSLCYGAFIRKGLLSRIALGLYALSLLLGVIWLLLFGGLAVMSGFFMNDHTEWAGKVEQMLAPEPKKEESVYKGYNTYELDDVNVFESGKDAENKSGN